MRGFNNKITIFLAAMARPVLKWVGGKRRLIEEIIKLFTGETPVIVENFHMQDCQAGKQVTYQLKQQAQAGGWKGAAHRGIN